MGACEGYRSMTTIKRTLPVARLAFAAILIVVLAAMFWSQSRYPSLNNKAMMSGTIQLEDPLSFEVLLPVDPSFPVWKKIVYTTINWIKTNKNGMLFGVFFGAAFLTLFRYLPRRSFRGRFSNSVLGMAIGAPLGVCVNCAAPIAKGMYSAGARAETTLSAMMASPTMNIVVLTMMFSIMPFYLAATKVALSVFVVLIAVPVIVRLLPPNQLTAMAVDADGMTCDIAALGPPPDEPLHVAVWSVAKDYTRDLWFIVSKTVPLMFLAGFLGAIVATLLPLEMLKDAPVNILTLVAVGLIGVFLPVPIAFDVVIAGTLLNAGLPIGVVMVLLFTLGIFSVYSYMIVANTISMRAATLVTATVVVLAVAAGLGAQAYQDRQSENALEYLTSEAGPVSPAIASPVGTAIR
jgi:uncharacterized membrane protein YraQ (UPF0718 family)